MYVGNMISRGGHSRPFRDHVKNDFKGGEFNTECAGVIYTLYNGVVVLSMYYINVEIIYNTYGWTSEM